VKKLSCAATATFGRPLHASFTADSGAAIHVVRVTPPEDAMIVAELMQRRVKTVESDASLAEAIVSLADAHISGVLVVDGAGKVVGGTS
jgi:CBS domain-containing protein